MNGDADSIDAFFQEWKQQDLDLPGLSGEMQFIYRIARMSKLLGRRLEQTVSQHGLTTSQFEALAALRRKHPHPLCAQDIMEASLLTSGSVTAMVNHLLKEGLVERSIYEADKRRIQVVLTRKGTKIIEAVLRERVKDNSLLAQLLSAPERREFNQLARRFLAGLEANTKREEPL